MLLRCVSLAVLLTLFSVTQASSDSSSAGNCTGTRSKSGSRLSHGSKARFAGVGENGLCRLADGFEEGLKARGKGLEEGLKATGKGIEERLKAQGGGLGKGFEQGMKYIACSIAFSSVAICFAIRK
jgi:hypothetical protein